MACEEAENAAGADCPEEKEMTCPYRKEQLRKEAPTFDHDQGPTVLDNLKLLKKARKLYGQAEDHRAKGDMDEARRCYEEVQRLCPGSGCDRLATDRLAEMDEPLSTGEATTEEEEAPAPPAPPAVDDDEVRARIGKMIDRCRDAFEAGRYHQAEHLMHRAAWKLHKLGRHKKDAPAEPKPVSAEEEQEPESPPRIRDCFRKGCSGRPAVRFTTVEELLQACHRAIGEGRLDEATELAHQALALDPVSVAADALVYKAHMLIHLQEEILKQKCQALDEECESLGTCVQELYRLGLPNCPEETYPGCDDVPQEEAVDPEIVDALQEVVEACGEVIQPRLILRVEEAGSPRVVVPMNIPAVESLLLPAVGELILAGDDEEAETDCQQSNSAWLLLDELVELALDSMDCCDCVEVDCDSLGRLRIHCQVQLGPVGCRLRKAHGPGSWHISLDIGEVDAADSEEEASDER
jgi:hypothetical protein